MGSFAERLAEVQEHIRNAAGRAGRSPDEVELIAVSKTHPPEAVTEALEAGQTLFGESRVQEAKAKVPLVSSRARWHFIGHLQKNKIRHAIPLFEMYHSVDSVDLARDIDRIAGEMGTFPRVLLEVNVAGESTKYGFRPTNIAPQIEELLALERLQIEGLMTIAPYVPEAEDARVHFVALRELRDRLETEFRLNLPHLSMGMSGDYSVAVEEGATLVRVGTALFGSRSGKSWRPTSGGSTSED